MSHTEKTEVITPVVVMAVAENLYEAARVRVGKRPNGEWIMPPFYGRDDELIERDLANTKAALEAGFADAAIDKAEGK